MNVVSVGSGLSDFCIVLVVELTHVYSAASTQVRMLTDPKPGLSGTMDMESFRLVLQGRYYLMFCINWTEVPTLGMFRS